jgi:hypothetical protein
VDLGQVSGTVRDVVVLDIARTCKNAVHASFGEDEHWGVENAQEETEGKIFIFAELVFMAMI